jgi:hypothetical protein
MTLWPGSRCTHSGRLLLVWWIREDVRRGGADFLRRSVVTFACGTSENTRIPNAK